MINLPRFGEIYNASKHSIDGKCSDIDNEGVKHYKSEQNEMNYSAMNIRHKTLKNFVEYYASRITFYETQNFVNKLMIPGGWLRSMANKNAREYLRRGYK